MMALRRGSRSLRVLLVLTSLLSLLYCFTIAGRKVCGVSWPLLKEDGIGNEYLKDIWNSTLGFEKLFVINMPSRTDRRDTVTLSAAISNISIDFIEGVGGGSVPEAALPPDGSSESIRLAKGIRGSWRSHMNSLQQIVHQNLASALIFEDDVDWDIRLRPRLEDFASASQFLTLSSHTDLSGYAIKASQNPENPDTSIHNSSSPIPISSELYSLPLSSIPKHSSEDASDTLPYGDPKNWDVLWLGHCGAGFPRSPKWSSGTSPSTANLILANFNDSTVPLPKYLRAHPFGPLDALAESHPPHTRVYHRGSGGVLCTVAYGVSQRGAKRLLHEFGVKRWSRIWDAELGDWCAGADFDRSLLLPQGSPNNERRGRRDRVCITVQPPVFAHHHPLGGQSNIGGVGGGYARNVETKYVRKSVSMNLEALARGTGEEGCVDQWPD